MRKAGLYDQYRYPNKLNISTDTVSTQQSSRANDRPYNYGGAASYRYGQNSGRGTPVNNSGRATPVHSVSSQPINSYAVANKLPQSMSGTSSFEIHDETDLIPRRRRVTRYGWIAFSLQLFSLLIVVAIFLGPGWGRSKRDARTGDERTYVHNYHGFWLMCTRQVVGGTTRCINDLYVDKEGWWISVQAMGCGFLVLTFISFLLICFYVFRIKSNRKWKLSLTHALVSILNSLVLASCLIVFAVNFKDNSWWCCPNGHRITESILFWAWYLGVVALLSQVISFAMTIAETCKLRS